eukprot:g1031.t1
MAKPLPVGRDDLEAHLDGSAAATTELEPDASLRREPAAVALCCLRRETWVRRRAFDVIHHPKFDKGILYLIAINAVAMAATDPTTEGGPQNDAIQIIEVTLNFCFLAEFLLKVVALGFWGGKGTYLGDNWNRLDFFCVILGIPTILALAGSDAIDLNGGAARTLRVLKVLRTIRSHEGMRTLVTSLLRSIALLVDVVWFLLFIFFIFGVIGVQLFQGNFHHRCYAGTGTGSAFKADCSRAGGRGRMELEADGQMRLCALSGYGRACPAGYACQLNDPCMSGANATFAPAPNSGFTHFDDIAHSFLVIFQCITLEGWSDVMYWANESATFGRVGSIYFVLLIVIGSFFAINLVLAVIQEAYEKTYMKAKQEREKRAGRLDSASIEALRTGNAGEDVDVNILIRHALGQHPPKESELHVLKDHEVDYLLDRFTSVMAVARSREVGDSGAFGGSSGGMQKVVKYLDFLCVASPSDECFRALHSLRHYLKQAADRSMDASQVFEVLDADGDGTVTPDELAKGMHTLGMPITTKQCSDIFHHIDIDGSGHINIHEFFQFASPPNAEERMVEYKLWQMFKHAAHEAQLEPFLQYDRDGNGYVSEKQFLKALQKHGFRIPANAVERRDSRAALNQQNRLREVCAFIISKSWFGTVVMIAIVTNTITLAAETNPPGPNQEALDKINLTLTFVFNVEMVLKLLGLGIYRYARDRMNVFDAIIVIVSDIELIILAVASSNSGLNISVLRTFRLLRIFRVFKLAKSWYNLKKLIETIMKSWLGLINFSCILALVIAIFALFGMQTFGGRLKSEDWDGPPYANFDNFYTSTLTVFQVLTGEDWNTVLYDCMRVEPVFGAILLAVMFFIGNYMMLSLFVAILLQNFQDAETDANMSYFKSVGAESDISRIGSIAARLIRYGLSYFCPALMLDVSMDSRGKKRTPVDLAVSNIACVVVLFFLIFGIAGVQLFGGKLGFCFNALEEQVKWNTTKAECSQQFVGNSSVVLQTWRNPPYHFDNVGAGMFTLLEVCTGEMWPTIMHSTMDVTSVGQPPRRQNNMVHGVFFILFIIICNMFIMSLFLGIVLFKFREIKEQENGALFLTDQQRVWLEMQKIMFRTRPEFMPLPPNGRSRLVLRVRKACFNLVTAKNFEMGIMVVIMLNTMVMASRHLDETSSFTCFAYVANTVFLVVYVGEAVCKIIGLGFRQYWRLNANRFDFFIVLGSLIDIFQVTPPCGAQAANSSSSSANVAILRVFRMARIFRLVSVSKNLKKIFDTLVLSLSSLINVGSVLVIMYFVFAVMGMNLFGKFDWNTKHTEYINSASEAGETLTRIYFVTFSILTSMMMVNLFIAVILENFGDMMKDYHKSISPEHIEAFQHEWSKVAPGGSAFIHSYELVPILLALPQPMGMRDVNKLTPDAIIKFIRSRRLRRFSSGKRTGMVCFVDIMHALCASEMPETQKKIQNASLENVIRQQLATQVKAQAIQPVNRHRHVKV